MRVGRKTGDKIAIPQDFKIVGLSGTFVRNFLLECPKISNNLSVYF